MYYAKKDKFIIENNTDYEISKAEMLKIDNFISSIDHVNYPYLTETVDNLEHLSERILEALTEYDKNRLKR